MTPASSRLEKALVGAILLLLVWAPLPVGSNRDWSASLLAFGIFALGALWAIHKLRAFRAPATITANITPAVPGWRSAALPLAALALAQCWVAAQWFGGITADSGETFRYLLLGVSYTLLFVLLVDLFRSRKRLIYLLATLVISGTLQAFYGALMTLSGTEWLLFGAKEHYLGVVTGTFVNRNHLAGYLEMTIACGIGLMLALRDGRAINWKNLLELLLSAKLMLRLAIVVMVIALVMSQSRMGNTGFAVGLAIAGGIYLLRNKQHRLRNALILASLIAVDVLVISQFFGLENLKNRLLTTQLEDQVVAGEVVRRENVDRDDIARYVLPQFKSRPWQGFGAGTFETSFQRYPGKDVIKDFDHAHNDYLQFATEFGLIGLIPLAAFVIMCLFQGFKALWQRQSLFTSGIGFGATMGVTALLVHSATDFNLQIPSNAATFVALCAIAVLANTNSNGRGESSQTGRRKRRKRAAT